MCDLEATEARIGDIIHCNDWAGGESHWMVITTDSRRSDFYVVCLEGSDYHHSVHEDKDAYIHPPGIYPCRIGPDSSWHLGETFA